MKFGIKQSQSSCHEIVATLEQQAKYVHRNWFKNRDDIRHIPVHMYMYIESSYRNVIIGIIIIGVSIDIASIVVSR